MSHCFYYKFTPSLSSPPTESFDLAGMHFGASHSVSGTSLDMKITSVKEARSKIETLLPARFNLQLLRRQSIPYSHPVSLKTLFLIWLDKWQGILMTFKSHQAGQSKKCWHSEENG